MKTTASEERIHEMVELLLDLISRSELMPADLYVKLRAEIEGQLARQSRRWDTKFKHIARWQAACAELDRNGWDGKQFINASNKLIGHQAHAGPDAVEKSYKWGQRNLSAHWRRPRTYAKRSK
jgi:hypothetical protein